MRSQYSPSGMPVGMLPDQVPDPPFIATNPLLTHKIEPNIDHDQYDHETLA